MADYQMQFQETIPRKSYVIMSYLARLLQFRSVINDSFEVEDTLVDSGSEISIMNHMIAVTNGIRIWPSKMKIKVASNDEAEVIGITDPITVQIGSNCVTVVFYVIKHDSVSVLLGADWLDISKVKFDQSGKSLISGEEIIYANEFLSAQRSVFSMQVDDEDGRPIDAIYEGEEEEMEDLGIDPTGKEEIEIITDFIFTAEEQQMWNELVPIIEERCSTGATD